MNIYYFLPDLKNPFWIEISEGVKKETISKNYSLKIFSAEDQSELQISQLNEALRKNPDAILISPLEVQKILGICIEMMQRRIPIVAIDQHMIHSVHASVISGNLTGGISAAKFIGDYIGNKTGIVHVQAPKNYENAALRRKSFINEIQRQNNIIIKVLEGACDRTISKIQMQQFLKEKIEFNAIFAESDVMALGVIDALKQVKYTPWPIIVGFDGIPEAIECIRNHTMSATIQQQPLKMGQKAVELINKIELGLPYDEVVNILTHLMTVETLK